MTSRRKKLSSTILSVFLLTALLTLFPLAAAKADEPVSLTDEQFSNIEVGCDSIKQSLKRIQNSDRNTRVSLGRSFQTIINDYVTPLNVRLVKNNRASEKLNEIQNRLADAREDFNHDYIAYSQELESLINTDCKKDPTDFYQKLERTRSKRANVAASVQKIQAIIDEHIKVVTEIRDQPEESEAEHD